MIFGRGKQNKACIEIENLGRLIPVPCLNIKKNTPMYSYLFGKTNQKETHHCGIFLYWIFDPNTYLMCQCRGQEGSAAGSPNQLEQEASRVLCPMSSCSKELLKRTERNEMSYEIINNGSHTGIFCDSSHLHLLQTLDQVKL